MALFDPRVVRAPSTQSMASKAGAADGGSRASESLHAHCPSVLPLRTAEAEAVSGTHLYAYLQEVWIHYLVIDQ